MLWAVGDTDGDLLSNPDPGFIGDMQIVARVLWLLRGEKGPIEAIQLFPGQRDTGCMQTAPFLCGPEVGGCLSIMQLEYQIKLPGPVGGLRRICHGCQAWAGCCEHFGEEGERA